MTTSAYRTLTVAEQIFKDLIWTPALKTGELYLEGTAPFLALPIVKQLDEALLQALSDWLFNSFITIVDITAIRLVNSAHQSAFDAASLDLKIIAHDKGVSSDEFRVAREKFRTDLSKFTRFGGG